MNGSEGFLILAMFLKIISAAGLLAAMSGIASAEAVFWLSSDANDGGSGDLDLEQTIEVFPESTAELTIWSKLTGELADLTVIGLSVAAEHSGPEDVLDFVNVELLNPLLATSGDVKTYRHQFVLDSTLDEFSPCESCEVSAGGDDTLENFSGLSIGFGFPVLSDGELDHIRTGVGIGEQAASLNDEHFVDPNWRIGSIEILPLRDGASNLILSEGELIDNPDVMNAPSFSFRELSLTVRIMPDYNRNGVVDAADYVLWRMTVGSNSILDADGNGDGMVDEADYEKWRTYFGRQNLSTTGSALSLPEGTTLRCLAIGIGFLFLHPRLARRFHGKRTALTRGRATARKRNSAHRRSV